MNIDGVFEGGGVKGIAFVGAICRIEEAGYRWIRLAGTSAGAIVAALLAVGYSGRELNELMLNINYKNLLDRNNKCFHPLLKKSILLIKDKGIYEGSYIEKWLAGLFKAKGKTKFKDVSVSGKSRLKIIASDITRREIMILPNDLPSYGINPMEFEIWKAVRMSISIPLYFKPVKLKYDKKFSFIVDGGLLSNFPIWIFDVNGKPRWPTFGFNLIDTKTKSFNGKTDIVSYLFDLVDALVNRNEYVYVREKDAVRIISIPTLGVETTNFNITTNKSRELFNSGYQSAAQFLAKWNFDNYVRKYRS